MIEGDIPKPNIQVDPMAEMFITRLIDLTNLRSRIDGDLLPVAYWNEIPISPQKFEQKGNLRWGVLKGISDAYSTLVDEGYEMEARAILSFQERREQDDRA